MKESTNNQSSADDNIQVLLTLYRSNRDNQELYFKQQWKGIYYVISLYCAIFAVFNHIDFVTYEFYMNIMGSIVFVFSTVIICIHECSLCETREADDNFRKRNELKVIEDIFGKSDSSKSKCIFYFMLIFNF